ncbi:hypothetical protein I2I05_13075 [Hymenobacter sp. BT683]|uniref:Uncharacterized protein n=1 Tax=Hymenobacter jeongseonensis TaxID=2791027 RepID=A0ABS0IJ19_9BACT|nr:hypothetical protein [Hymenobacter jeongseonensis]
MNMRVASGRSGACEAFHVSPIQHFQGMASGAAGHVAGARTTKRYIDNKLVSA